MWEGVRINHRFVLGGFYVNKAPLFSPLDFETPLGVGSFFVVLFVVFCAYFLIVPIFILYIIYI